MKFFSRTITIHSFVGREHLFLWGLAVLAVGGLALLDRLGTHLARERVYEDAAQRLRAQSGIRVQSLERRTQRLGAEVQFLASVPPVHGMVRASVNHGIDALDGDSYLTWRRRLEGIFSAYARTSPEILQVRLIGVADQGRELVRINRLGDRIEVVPDSLLQRKGDRPYFQATLGVPPGDYLISKLELNREFGRIQLPLTPTLRGTTPVYAPDGNLFGMVVVNLDARILLEDLRKSLQLPYRLYLLDDQGQFLVHPDTAREYGLDKGNPWRWGDEFTDLAAMDDSVQKVRGKIVPGSLLVFSKRVDYNRSDRGTSWSLVTAVRGRDLEERVDQERKYALSISAGIVCSGAVILYLLLVSMVRRVQVREFQARLGAMVDSSPDAIVGLDPQGRVVGWNRAALDLFDANAPEPMGQPLLALLPVLDTNDLENLDELLARAAAGESPTLVFRVGTPPETGDRKIVQASVHPVRNSQGEVESLAATLRDVTERESARRRIEELNHDLERQVAERTRHIEELLTLQGAILQHAGWAIVATDREGLIRVFNPSAEALLGRTFAETFGRSPMEFHDPAEMEAMVQEIRRREGWDLEGLECLLAGLEKEGSQIREWTWIRKDGSRVPVLLSISLLKDSAGVPLGFICIGQDLTERRTIEETLRMRTEEAEVAGRAKADFLANMSHEIRTPLNGVLGLAAALSRRSLDPLSRELVAKIRQSGDLLRTLLDDILDMSKIQAGKLQLEVAPFSLDAVLDGIASLVSIEADRKGLELVVGAVPGRVSRLIGDAHRLQQVLMNLVGNAIKFTERGSVVVEIEDRGDRDDSVVVAFSVRDTGMGIATEAIPRLFEAFTQEDASTTRRFGGTGLGLAISRLLVEKMQGTIEVQSELGSGTTFRFTSLFRRSEREVDPSGGIRHLEVLVVDDSEPSRNALAKIAHSIGWNAEERSDGQGALRALMDRHDAGGGFDVLLIDWKMPGMDGIATAKVVREVLQGRVPPVVLLATSHSLEELERAPGKELVDGVLIKPVTGSRLFDAVTRTLERKGQRLDSLVDSRPQNRMRGLRILIVDDNEINLDVGSLLCREEGAQVVLASDGQQALSLLETDENFDLVLMDVQMPRMDGCEATRRIRAMPHRANLPVVALTAGVLDEERQAAQRAGVDGFLGKPFLPEELVAVVTEVLAGAPEPSGEGKDAGGELVFDPSVGLRIWKNPRDLSLQLEKFLRQHAGAVEVVTRALEAGDASIALHEVHRLHSAAGFLGLHRLAEASKRVEKSLRAQDAWQEPVGEFARAMEATLVALEEWNAREGV